MYWFQHFCWTIQFNDFLSFNWLMMISTCVCFSFLFVFIIPLFRFDFVLFCCFRNKWWFFHSCVIVRYFVVRRQKKTQNKACPLTHGQSQQQIKEFNFDISFLTHQYFDRDRSIKQIERNVNSVNLLCNRRNTSALQNINHTQKYTNHTKLDWMIEKRMCLQ